MKSTKIGVIYARYSSSVQTEQSIEGQVRECLAYAQRNGIAILDTYVDRATTGTNDKRERFQKLHELEKKIEFYAVRARKAISREEIRENLEVAMKQEAAMLIRLLIKNVVVYNDKIEIYFNGVENGSPDENSHQGWLVYSETIDFNGGEVEVVIGV